MTNIQRTLTEEWHCARQAHDETIQAYAARLDELAEDIGKVLTEDDRAEKFRVGLRYLIKAEIDKQASQATTYRDLVAQAQRIKTHERGYRSTNRPNNNRENRGDDHRDQDRDEGQDRDRDHRSFNARSDYYRGDDRRRTAIKGLLTPVLTIIEATTTTIKMTTQAAISASEMKEATVPTEKTDVTT